jgi:hypothetical protein
MSLSAIVDHASSNDENGGLVGYRGGERINFEEVIGVLSSE